MNATRLTLFTVVTLLLLAPAAFSADEFSLAPLQLERSCDSCHDVSNPGGLTGNDWLAQMKAMGPIESLPDKKRVEVTGFLRHHGWEVNTILAATAERHLFEDKCGVCHAVERIFIEQADEKQIPNMVERMRQREPLWISDEDAKTITDFILAGARGVRRPEHGEISGSAADVFRGRCAGCHPLERTYLYLETTLDPAWPLLVKKSQLKAPGWISDAEAEKIVDYLSNLKRQLR